MFATNMLALQPIFPSFPHISVWGSDFPRLPRLPLLLLLPPSPPSVVRPSSVRQHITWLYNANHYHTDITTTIRISHHHTGSSHQHYHRDVNTHDQHTDRQHTSTITQTSIQHHYHTGINTTSLSHRDQHTIAATQTSTQLPPLAIVFRTLLQYLHRLFSIQYRCCTV